MTYNERPGNNKAIKTQFCGQSLAISPDLDPLLSDLLHPVLAGEEVEGAGAIHPLAPPPPAAGGTRRACCSSLRSAKSKRRHQLDEGGKINQALTQA